MMQPKKKEGPISPICYQEHANIATACGGLSTGTYIREGYWVYWATGESIDGDWQTSEKASIGGPAYTYIDYTKPSKAIGSSLWVVKMGEESKFNPTTIKLSIPPACWDNQPLKFRLYSLWDWNGVTEVSYTEATASCFDGVIWQQLYQTSLVGGGTAPFANNLYEEGMEWSLEISPVDCSTIKGNALSSITSWSINPTTDNKNKAITDITEWAINC